MNQSNDPTQDEHNQEKDHDPLLAQINNKVSELTIFMQRLYRPGRFIWLNFLGGISKGFGIAVGITIFTGTVLYLLEKLGALELPIIGDYITSLVNYVQNGLELRK
ncbi:DUF5665 domain-containing protein [Paenibacillus sp. N1-5-1-14]|uniref:DUF5665 domain-containing protein n=1 Tax=Paenibacillus radicibacter TaxID=2972488 RepID=UPI0021593A5D|nr:DUF5665 domain-containing protein [Paenibacillus radicibacter]MCR8641899.1 DUF5665 domain-containing protein [Paenibacillus radicibacter]